MAAAIYVRQSIEKKDSESIEVQIEFAKRYLEPDEEFEIFSDPGFSGKNTARPGFQRMLNGIEYGKFNKLIVYKLDRISRNVADFSWLMELLKKYNCSFISAKENFSLDTPAGRAMLYMTSTFAQMERESTSERVKDNFYERLKLGVVGGGSAPLGYTSQSVYVAGKKHSMYVLNSDIEIIKTMFEVYSNPLTTLADVKKVLHDKHKLNMQTSDISRRLKNPTYVKADAAIYNYYYKAGANIESDISEFNGVHGCLLAGRRKSNERKYTNVKEHVLTIGKHEGVIDSETFLFCQNKLSANRQIKNTYRGQYTWLSGMIKCGACGKAMVVKRYKVKGGYSTNLYCSNQSTHQTCEPHTHHVEDVEDYVLGAMQEKLETLSKLEESNKNNQNNNILNLHKELDDINARIENLVLNLEQAGQTTITYINKRIEELDALKTKIQAELDTCSYISDKYLIPDISDWNSLSLEKKKEAARSLIEKVVISPDSSIFIYWRV